MQYPGGSQSIEFYNLRIKIKFITASATNSPVLEGITIRFLMRPEEVYGWSFNLPLALNMDMGESLQEKPVKEVLDDLEEARTSKSPIEFIDIFGLRNLVYVTSLTTQAVEVDRDEGGAYPNVEHIAQVNLVQAR